MIELGRIDHGIKIAKAAGFISGPSDVVISRTDEYGELLGGVVYYDFTGLAVSMHVAGFSPTWICRDLLWIAFDYPFRQLKCKSIFCQVKSSNERAIKFIFKIGFKKEVLIPEVFPEADLLVCRLRDTECRWLGIRPKNITSGGKEDDASRSSSVH